MYKSMVRMVLLVLGALPLVCGVGLGSNLSCNASTLKKTEASVTPSSAVETETSVTPDAARRARRDRFRQKAQANAAAQGWRPARKPPTEAPTEAKDDEAKKFDQTAQLIMHVIQYRWQDVVQQRTFGSLDKSNCFYKNCGRVFFGGVNETCGRKQGLVRNYERKEEELVQAGGKIETMETTRAIEEGDRLAEKLRYHPECMACFTSAWDNLDRLANDNAPGVHLGSVDDFLSPLFHPLLTERPGAVRRASTNGSSLVQTGSDFRRSFRSFSRALKKTSSTSLMMDPREIAARVLAVVAFAAGAFMAALALHTSGLLIAIGGAIMTGGFAAIAWYCCIAGCD